MTESTNPQKAQLDKAEREQLENIVTQMRERVEDNVRFQLTRQELDSRPERIDELDAETKQLVEAIDLEATDGESWSEALEKYVTGVGYTIVNRLTALRCMEVREFIDEEVTAFKQNGLTPAAETLVQQEFLLEDEAILEAYYNACDTFAEEIEILFDRSSAYSLVDPDDDTFEELCEMLDSIPSRIWRADDVLGWIYEYYNVKLLDDLRRKGDREGLEPEDVPPANQFYTPHWVVRMLTDNSLGKLYLEHTGELQNVVKAQKDLSPNERKNRPLSLDQSPDISDFCTYLVSSEQEGEPTDFKHPEEVRVIDPACGSGHFLLYAFDVLERIWRAETDLAKQEIPRKILQNNIYGIDLDMRACQLAAFNLYLKGRTRAEAEGADGFDMPDMGIVCADASIAEIDGVEKVFDQVSGDNKDITDALRRILESFERVHGLGSLLDVRGTLGDLFEDDAEVSGTQLSLADDPRKKHTLKQILASIREAVEEQRGSNSLLARDLRSFVRLLDILVQEYDVALMNPPYGTQNRMPDNVTRYVNNNYKYKPEFYMNFFEVCDNIVKSRGRVGMIIPTTFMFKTTFKQFRKDFIGKRGSFDFLAEYGPKVLDNATVRTAGTVIRIDQRQSDKSDFYRLHDIEKGQKEQVFAKSAFGSEKNSRIRRHYRKDLSEFSIIPGTPISYWVPSDIRSLYKIDTCFDSSQNITNKDSVGAVKTGLQTGNNDRFLRKFWEVENAKWVPFAKGGSDAWILPRINRMVLWNNSGNELKRISGSRVQNEQYYNKEGLTYTNVKQSGKRFGYLHPNSIFGVAGQAFIPDEVVWQVLAYSNSNLATYLVLALTTGRHWQVGEVSRIPWDDGLANSQQLKSLSKEILTDLLRKRAHDVNSPFYIGPLLLSLTGYRHNPISKHHPHRDLLENMDSIGFLGNTDTNMNLRDVGIEAARYRKTVATRLDKKQELIDNKILDYFDISSSLKQEIYTEISLRTNETPGELQLSIPRSVDEVPEDYESLVKNLVHHFAIEAVSQENDGIIPVSQLTGQPDMLDRIIDRFRHAYGEHADDRLLEVDEILGDESASEEAFPNIRTFITEDLFSYHVNQMEKTPILWKLTTKRLVADTTSEGFGCFVDYRNLDSGLLDKLTSQYLEPRKAELRERQSAAQRRRSNKSLSTSEQTEAAEKYERLASGLNQVTVFEGVLQDLGKTTERGFVDQQLLKELAPMIASFRNETKKRIDTLSELRERKGKTWFRNTFSNKFWETVNKWSEMWIDSLDELERACEEYAKPTDESVEPHLADLFGYFNRRLKGSDHYSSTGILFMTYYFDREGSGLLNDNGEPLENLKQEERQLATLATGLDDSSIVDKESLNMIAKHEGVKRVDDLPPLAEFKSLAEEIGDRCQTIDSQIPSDWADRALSEITTEGYKPNHKHGVKINIKPLAEAKIVPETVDNNVL